VESFAIHGVQEAARLFFSKDVHQSVVERSGNDRRRHPVAVAAVALQQSGAAKERRNVVLQAMADSGFISQDAGDRACKEPLQMAARALDAEAPYFVDYIGQELQEKYPKETGAIDVYTTLDLHMQRIAQDVVREGLTHVDELLAKRKRQRAQAALIAVDPRTGDVLALVGGRSYNQSNSTRNRGKASAGSSFKPFVISRHSSAPPPTAAPTSRQPPSSSTSRRPGSSISRRGRPVTTTANSKDR
jgi:penicillin-binding protein 1B